MWPRTLPPDFQVRMDMEGAVATHYTTGDSLVIYGENSSSTVAAVTAGLGINDPTALFLLQRIEVGGVI